jgi:hypothetical protein
LLNKTIQNEIVFWNCENDHNLKLLVHTMWLDYLYDKSSLYRYKNYKYSYRILCNYFIKIKKQKWTH